MKLKTRHNENPFTDSFVLKEIKFYGISNYNKNSIKIETVPILGRCDDYLNVNFRNGSISCPRFFINNKLWMSLTPMEIQSHYVPIKQAIGNISVGGLGMGYFLLKVMKKNNVKSIDVYELEESVVNFFIENFKHRKGFNKVNFIIGDIRETMKNKIYDFVYMDIYAEMLSDLVISDKKLFLKNNKISNYHFAYEYNLLPTIPLSIFQFFIQWSESKGAKLKDNETSKQFVTKCLETFDQSFFL